MRPALSCLLLCCAALSAQEARLDETALAGDGRGPLAACAERLEALKPKDAKVLAEAGRFQLLAGNTRKGEDLVHFAEMADPKDREVMRLIGLAYLKAGRRKEAVDAYDKVLTRDGGSRKSIGAAGIDLAEAGMAKEADRLMEAYGLLEQNDWEMFVAFGRGHLKGSSRRNAAPWFKKAILLKLQEEKVYLEIGRAYAEYSRPAAPAPRKAR